MVERQFNVLLCVNIPLFVLIKHTVGSSRWASQVFSEPRYWDGGDIRIHTARLTRTLPMVGLHPIFSNNSPWKPFIFCEYNTWTKHLPTILNLIRDTDGLNHCLSTDSSGPWGSAKACQKLREMMIKAWAFCKLSQLLLSTYFYNNIELRMRQYLKQVYCILSSNTLKIKMYTPSERQTTATTSSHLLLWTWIFAK
jgi:hypothetical protein